LNGGDKLAGAPEYNNKARVTLRARAYGSIYCHRGSDGSGHTVIPFSGDGYGSMANHAWFQILLQMRCGNASDECHVVCHERLALAAMRNREIMTEIHNHMVSVTSATQSASIVQLRALLGGFLTSDKRTMQSLCRLEYIKRGNFQPELFTILSSFTMNFEHNNLSGRRRPTTRPQRDMILLLFG
jgi:hypothetical protein